jgi:hypothetical protein
MRPVLGGLAITIPLALVIYLATLYQGTEQTDPLTVAATIQRETRPDDVIASDLPTVGIAIEFYAQRKIWWDISREGLMEWLATTHDPNQRAYYFYCGEPPALPLYDAISVIEGCSLAQVVRESVQLHRR